MSATFADITEAELNAMYGLASALEDGSYCPDPSPFHADLVARAAKTIERLRFEADLMTPVVKAATEFIADDSASKAEQWHALRDALNAARAAIEEADAR